VALMADNDVMFHQVHVSVDDRLSAFSLVAKW